MTTTYPTHTTQISPNTTSVSSARYFTQTSPLFAHPRYGNQVKAFTTGREYYADLAKELAQASKFVFITDWQMDFDVELDDRGSTDHKKRLSELLANAIQRGVHIRIMLYDSVDFASSIGTPDTHEENTQSVLQTLNHLAKKGAGSIDVMVQNQNSGRSADIAIGFSHHQKSVVIDGKIGYIGGMDLTYGRWDNNNLDVVIERSLHVINDAYNQQLNPARAMTQSERDLTNSKDGRPGFAAAWDTSRIRNKVSVDNKVFDEGFQPREPWQDVHMRIDGPAVFDIFKNFVRRWNSFAGYGSNALDSPLTKRWFESIGGTQTLVDPLARGSGDAIVQILRSVSGAQNKEEYATLRDTTLIDTMDDWKTHNPANRGAWMKALASWNGLNTTNILQAMRNCIQAAEAFIYIENQYFMSECGNSELGQKGFVLNPVVNDLAIKIAGAIYRGRPFHVYLVMPVHPEGKLEDGNTEANQYWQIQAIKHGTSSLYHRIKAALLVKRNGTKKLTFTQEELNAVPDSDVEQYVTVLNMRNFSMTTHYARDEKTGEINTNQMLGRYVITEQIYVHSKLLIVDDAVAIIGSANINDRSLMGNGDTELAAIVVDGSSTSRDAGQGIKVETRDFARNLRIKLWRKHLGMEVEGDAHGVQHQGVPAGINLDQPLSKATITAIKQLAKANASTYESVFTHTPRNSFKTLTEGRNLYPRGIDGPPPPLSDAYMANGTYQWQRPKNSQENFAEVQKQTQMRQQMQRDGVSIPAKTPYQDHLDIENRIMPPQIIEPFSYNGKIPNVDKAVKYLKSQVKGYWTLAPLDWGKGSDAGEKATRNVWIAENENHEKGSA